MGTVYALSVLLTVLFILLFIQASHTFTIGMRIRFKSSIATRVKSNILGSLLTSTFPDSWPLHQYSQRLFSSRSPSNDPKKDLQVHMLPRMYVGPSPVVHARHLTDLINPTFSNMNTNTPPSRHQALHFDLLISLNQAQSHHLTSVLRLGKKRSWRQQQSQVRLFDGHTEWLAQPMEGTLERKRRHRGSSADPVVLRCLELLRRNPLTHQRDDDQETIASTLQRIPSIWIATAPPKRKERLRMLIEKCVELGVDGFLHVNSEYSETPELGASKLQAYAMEAAQQCERMNVPPATVSWDKDECQVEDTSDPLGLIELELLIQLVEESDSSVKLLVCRERSNLTPIWSALGSIFHSWEHSSASQGNAPQHGDALILCLIGPEGGWSQAEEQLLDRVEEATAPKNQVWNVSLGPTVLRAETAAMTAMAAVHLFRDMFGSRKLTV